MERSARADHRDMYAVMQEFAMIQRQKRSVLARVLGVSTGRAGHQDRCSDPARLSDVAGRPRATANDRFESLEPRVLLAGDHASFPDFPGATFVDLGPGSAFATGVIDIDMGMVDPGDLFRFTAPATDFVRILAESRNIPTSSLDTRLELFNAAGELIASASNSGQLTSGTPTDAFIGFVAQEGEDYFVHVMGESMNPLDPTAAGAYILRLDTMSIPLDVALNGVLIPEGADPTPMPQMPPIMPFGVTPVTGSLGADDPANPGNPFNLDDEVFVFTVPQNDGTFPNAVFGTLATASASAFGPMMVVDTRIEIYDATGQLVASDSLSAFDNDPFTTFNPQPGDTFFVRVRSDEFNANFNTATFANAPSAGNFLIDINLAPRDLPINPVTRVFDSGIGPNGLPAQFFDPSPDGVDSTLVAMEFASDTGFFSFTAVGDGTAIITLVDVNGPPPPSDFEVRLYGPDGQLLIFIDDDPGIRPQITFDGLVGGERYFIVVSTFDEAGTGNYGIVVESNVTNNTSSDVPIDDHPNTPFDATTIEEVRRQFELATALSFGPVQVLEDGFGNAIVDFSYFITAQVQARIDSPDDTDLFQFVPQVDLLGTLPGNDDGLGTGVFIGGNFTAAALGAEIPVNSHGITIHDGGSYFFSGWTPGNTADLNPMAPNGFGFLDNDATPDTDGPEFYSMLAVPSIPVLGIFQPALIVGGDFTLLTPDPMNPGGGAPIRTDNLAILVFDNTNSTPAISNGRFQGTRGGYVWQGFLGGTDAPVRALAEFEPDAGWDPNPNVSDDEIDLPQGRQIVIAGEFNEVGGQAFNKALSIVVDGPDFGTVIDIGALAGFGANDIVYTLAVYDPQQPPAVENAMGESLEITDLPNSIFLGGDFTASFTSLVPGVGAVNQDGVILFTGGEVETPFIGQMRQNVSFNGPVFALHVHDLGFDNALDPIVIGAAGLNDQAPESFVGSLLYIAGDLSGASISGQVSGENIFRYGWVPSDDFDPLNSPERLNITPVLNGPDGPVFALETYVPPAVAAVNTRNLPGGQAPDFNGPARSGEADPFARPILVAGGDFTALTNGNPAEFLTFWDAFLHEELFIGGVTGPVFALANISDQQEPGIAVIPDGPVDEIPENRGVLYIGGDFQDRGNILRFDVFGIPNPAGGTAAYGFSMNGLADSLYSDPPGTNGPVTVIAAFDEFPAGSDGVWDRNDRASGRASLTVSPTADAFLDAFVRIYDSNFNVIYENDTISPPFPDPAGGTNPATSPAGLTFQLPPMWGGEVYYIEVSSTSGSGRYNLSVTMEGVPPDDDAPGSGVIQDVNSVIIGTQNPNIVGFGGLSPIIFNAAGDADLTRNVQFEQPVRLGLDQRRIYRAVPSLGAGYQQTGDLGIIQTIDDADVYRFTAATTGVFEIWVQTIDLVDQFDDTLLDGVLNKTYTSPLDSMLRVFNNDFEQIAFNDDNGVVNGERQAFDVGGLGTFEFTQRDARILVNVRQGETYFVVVESAQRYADGSPANPADRVLRDSVDIDQRFAIGSYNLLVNGTPSASQIPGDDHTNFNQELATPITLGADGRSALGLFRDTAGTPNDPSDDTFYDGTIGSVTDIDLFRFVPMGSGNATITVERAAGSTLIPSFQVLDAEGNVVAAATATSLGVATDTAPLLRGQTYFLQITGIGVTTGRYSIDLQTAVAGDDFADVGKLHAAQRINLLDFQASGSIEGVINFAGDTDLFRFSAFTTQQFTITVTPTGTGVFNPSILVYEVSENINFQNPGVIPPVAPTPMFRLIGASNDRSEMDFSSEVTVPVQGNRTSPITGETYNDYFIVVRGQNPNFDTGSYRVTVSYDPSDDHADLEQILVPATRSLATLVVINPADGTASADGVIELEGDTDAFRFTPPAGGQMILNLLTPGDSQLGGVMTVYTLISNVLTPIATTAPGGPTILDFMVNRGQQYFLVVDGDGVVFPGQTNTGAYSVSFTGPALDDHPNAGEFNIATFVPLDSATGNGQVGTEQPGGNPTISPPNDTDLFTFITVGADMGSDPLTVTVTPVGNPIGLRPRLTLFDAAQMEITQTFTSSFDTPVSISIPGVAAGVRFYVLVEDAFGAAPAGSEYVLFIDSAPGAGTQPTDPDFIDFTNPDAVLTPSIRGNAEATGAIDVPGDRDLYTYTAAADGTIYVQVTTPDGSPLDAQIFIYDQPSENPAGLVASDSEGRPGATANLQFEGVRDVTYYIIVDGVAAGTGAYTLRIDGVAPDVFTGIPSIDANGFNYRIYYPEGFANQNVSEFVSIANANNEAVNFSIIVRYQFAQPRDFVVVQNGVIGAGQRSGVTLSNGSQGVLPGLLVNEPYAIEIVSSAPLAANLSHYDFNSSTGEAFTEELSTEWVFPRVQRAAGLVRDFVLYYNPYPFDVRVTLTAEGANGPITVQRIVPAFRRGGLDINAQAALPTGIFGATLTSEPVNPANAANYEGVVASLTHFDIAGSSGYAVLGDPSGGARAGAIPSITRESNGTAEIVIYNPGDLAATVDLTGQYIRAALPDLVRRVQVPAKSTLVLTGASLNLIANQPIGFEYVSDRAISVVASETKLGDANATLAVSAVGTQYFIGDAFIGFNNAGTLYFETLSFYNPTQVSQTITVELLYANGQNQLLTVNVGARDFGELVLHENNAFLNNPNRTRAFAINVSSPLPFGFSFEHYDLFINGGWGSNGAPIGLLNTVSSIIF